MENTELIKALREDAEWAHANEWETPITLSDHLDAACCARTAERRNRMKITITFKDSSRPKVVDADDVYTKGEMLCFCFGNKVIKYHLMNIHSVEMPYKVEGGDTNGEI